MTVPKPPRPPVLTIPLSLPGRIGCGLALVLWFTLLSLPCAMFWLASGNELRLAHGSVPDAYDHPLLEVGLIMTTDNRGLKFKTSVILPAGDAAVCVQTDLRYLLWYTREDDPTTVFCNCYTRDTAAAAWQNTGSRAGACTTPSGGTE
ncbi:MAG: hypothetical protein MUE40_04920 [Anaerolineae bacterium]|jgi:hypothetical protein|nr:hypothetical protein [Anaerolineae bacterium]